MGFKRIFLNCLGCLLTTVLNAQENPLPLPTLSESEIAHFQILVEGNNRFGFEFFQQLRHQPGNLFFSSYSIVTGLGMVAVGAKGETARQFQHVFRYSLPLLLFIGDLNASLHNASGAKKSAEVWIVNELWLDKSVKVLPSFTQALKRNFHFALQPVDFSQHFSQSIQNINQSIAKQTEGKINQFLLAQDVTATTRMLLTTAAYIKGKWAYPFDEKLTKRLLFHVSRQRRVMTEMMQLTANYFLWKGERWDMVAIPYEVGGEGAQLSMAVLLPKKEVDLEELEKHCILENWKKWKSQLRPQLVTLTLPSFRIDKRLDLDLPLKGLGLSKVFNPAANFLDMTEEKGIYLNAAIHKTSIRIDEKGANVSGVMITKQLNPVKGEEQPYEFLVDRPFIFIIWDQKTDSILFIGRVSIP